MLRINNFHNCYQPTLVRGKFKWLTRKNFLKTWCKSGQEGGGTESNEADRTTRARAALRERRVEGGGVRRERIGGESRRSRLPHEKSLTPRSTNSAAGSLTLFVVDCG